MINLRAAHPAWRYIYIYILYTYIIYICGASGFAAHMVPECKSFFLRFILSMDPKDWCDWVPQRFCRWDDFESASLKLYRDASLELQFLRYKHGNKHTGTKSLH